MYLGGTRVLGESSDPQYLGPYHMIIMLVYHKAIHFPRLKSHLMCPMQSWMAGVRINEFPKFLAENPDEKTHTIIVNDPLNLNELLTIPFALKGSQDISCTVSQKQVNISMNLSRTLTLQVRRQCRNHLRPVLHNKRMQ